MVSNACFVLQTCLLIAASPACFSLKCMFRLLRFRPVLVSNACFVCRHVYLAASPACFGIKCMSCLRACLPSCVSRPVLVSNVCFVCEHVYLAASPACFGIKFMFRLQACCGRQDRQGPTAPGAALCDSCLLWHVCFLTCLIAFFFWLVSLPVTFAARWLSSLWSLRQVRAQLRLEQHCATQT